MMSNCVCAHHALPGPLAGEHLPVASECPWRHGPPSCTACIAFTRPVPFTARGQRAGGATDGGAGEPRGTMQPRLHKGPAPWLRARLTKATSSYAFQPHTVALGLLKTKEGGDMLGIYSQGGWALPRFTAQGPTRRYVHAGPWAQAGAPQGETPVPFPLGPPAVHYPYGPQTHALHARQQQQRSAGRRNTCLDSSNDTDYSAPAESRMPPPGHTSKRA